MFEAELGDNGRFRGMGLCEGIRDEIRMSATHAGVSARISYLQHLLGYKKHCLCLFVDLSLSLLSFTCGFCPQVLFDEAYLDFFPRIWIFLLLQTNYILSFLFSWFRLGCHFFTAWHSDLF